MVTHMHFAHSTYSCQWQWLYLFSLISFKWPIQTLLWPLLLIMNAGVVLFDVLIQSAGQPASQRIYCLPFLLPQTANSAELFLVLSQTESHINQK